MLRLHRHRHQSKSGEQVDFKLHGFKALQVPKGWDKLVVSVVSMKTGKTVAKTGKAAAHNGSCVWGDTLSESIRFSNDDTAKEIEDSLSKLVVSMGSVRSGILGEATVNMKDYMSTSESVPVSLSLKKCTHGTTLQVKIQCLTPRIKSMDEDSKERISDLEKPNGTHQDIGMKSEESGSDSAVAKSLTSSSANDFRLNSNPGELGSRETSFSLSESHQSYDSAEGSTGGEDMSVGDHGSDVQSLVRRADSLGSENSESQGIHRAEILHAKQTSFNSQASENSAKAFREASGGTVEELRAEAKMWERNARKLMLDLDVLKAEFSDHSKIRESLSMELSAACAERDDLRKEIEQLRQTSSADFRTDDLRFERESNANLAMQLKRSHESNVELVSILQDLEETVERQKVEMEELLALQSKFVDVEKSAAENGEENRKLRAQLEEMKELEKDLSGKVKLLEQVLEEKNQQIEKGKILNSQAFFDVETEYKSRLVEKDGEIAKLKARMLDSLEATNGGDADLIREVEELKAKVQELERDCTELTEENLDLLFKLKKEKSEPMRMSTSVDFPARTSFEFQLSEQNLATSFTEQNSEKNESVLSVDLEAKLAEMDRELTERRTSMEKLEVNLRSKEEEIAVMRRCRSELEAKVSELQKEKAQIQEHLEVVLQESDISSKCLNDLQNDVAVLTSSVDSHSLANKLLERKSSELKTGYQELESENEQLSNLVVSLEARLRDLTGQLESSQLELENSKSRAINLSDGIDRLRDEMQSTVESLIEENDSLHRSNEESRNEKLELSDRCSLLETKLEESRKGFADCSKKVGGLEQYLASVLAEFESKEKSLALEIDALVEENLRHKDKFSEEERLLNQMYMEKVVEAQKLQQEVEHLIKKLSESHEEKERIAFDSFEELTRLQAENEGLKADFEENQFKIKQIESAFNSKETDYVMKLKKLSSEVADSNEGLEKLSQLLDKYKLSESKFKTTISDLELKLTVSEYQRQQHSEECAYLKAELKKLAHLEVELGDTNVEKAKLEALAQAMSEECQDLKAEKTELIEKISALKTLVSELEGCNREKLALQEKALQMEDELVEIEVLRVRDTELQKELNQIRKENKQYQQKIEQLQALEEEKQNSREQNGNRKVSNFSKTNAKVNPVHEAAKNPKNEMAKNANRRRDNGKNQSQKENGGGCESLDGSPRNVSDTNSKIQLLEDQLSKAFEEISNYKAQLNKVSTEGRKGHADSPRKATQDALVSKAKYERTKSVLEAELRDIRERYSVMSLKYAEVEAQREELVMKLKSTAKASKRWFS